MINGQIDRNGVRIGDNIILHPLRGNKRNIKLMRSKYELYNNLSGNCNHDGTKICLPTIDADPVDILLFTFKLYKDQSRDDDCRFVIKSKNDQTIKVNGVFTREAYLQRGDIVDIGHNRLIFSRPSIGSGVDNVYPMFITPNFITSKLNILLLGETGIGKTYWAQKIYDQGSHIGRFIHLNISALSPSLVESELFGHVKGAFTGASINKKGALFESDKGVLFLDEIDSLSLNLQAKLLLFLDNYEVRPVGGDFSRKVDVKVIFAANRDLRSMVKQKEMRQDFYFRINSGISIKLQPLRKQKEIISNIINQFEIKNFIIVDSNLRQFYLKLPWYGNIRQLKGHLEKKKFFSNSNRLNFDDLDREILQDDFLQNREDLRECWPSLSDLREQYIKEVYYQFDNNIHKSSKVLGIASNTLRKVLEI
ncbi:MAG: sigma-54-dependent Fis family transcriptional regulator [Bdellovibrionales bacterium]|jgi:transcriptional regulator with AAA-type ATPase domain|nr:sigma-54-dependent Fis family transcriptional regulator [Bdellovibrionales bacterium]